MTLQIHAVMQYPQHINDVPPLKTVDSKHEEVSSFTSFSSDMKGPDICADIAALFNADDGGAGAQFYQRG